MGQVYLNFTVPPVSQMKFWKRELLVTNWNNWSWREDSNHRPADYKSEELFIQTLLDNANGMVPHWVPQKLI